MKNPTAKLEPLEKSSNPIDARVSIGHVHLKTADIEPIKKFYVGILGFDVVTQIPGAIFLSAGGYHHHLAFNTWESANGQPPPRNSTGLYHIAIRYPDRATLADALRRLADASWPLEGVNDHGTHEALYLRDPDDNGLELFWDRPEEEWPLDLENHLTLGGGSLDLESLLKAGLEKK